MKEKFWALTWGVFFTLATFASGLLSWLTPLPLFYIGRKYSIRFALLGWALVFALTAFIYLSLLGIPGEPPNFRWLEWFLWLPGMAYYKGFGMSGVLKALSVYYAFSFSFSILLIWKSKTESQLTRLASYLSLGSLFFTLFVFLLCMGPFQIHAFIELLHKHAASLLDQFLAFNRSNGVNSEEIIYIDQNREAIVRSFVALLPGMVLSGFIFLVWFNLYIARRLFSPFGFFERVQELIFFRLPFVWVWGIVLCLALFLSNLYLWHHEALSFALLNVFIVFLTVYFFQGLAVLGYFLMIRQLAAWLRLLCYFLLIVFIQPLGLLLVGLGFFDSWYDFRKMNVQIKS